MRIIFLVLLLFLQTVKGIQPTKETLLYPNTENSPSLYLFSFMLSNDVPKTSYFLINLDWYGGNVVPYHCQFISTSTTVPCTNFNSPTFPITITVANMKQHNSLLTEAKTIVVDLTFDMLKQTQYYLQIYLYNVTQNIQKISPSIQFYVVSESGLIYQQNLNYGPSIHKPPFNNLLSVSKLGTNLSQLSPGSYATLLAQFTINIPISTPLSSFLFILPYPFTFTTATILRTYDAQSYATSGSALQKAPTLKFSEKISENIFSVVFNETFVKNRKFILELTDMQTPFYLAKSNMSIYSMNYGSLTPLQGFQQQYPIQTITFGLSLSLGLPYDIPITGPCQFYRNDEQYVKLNTVIPYKFPEGYMIKIKVVQATIIAGTASANFQNVAYVPTYEYANTELTIKNMGPIQTGYNFSITFRISKNSITTLQTYMYIDTQAVIKAGTASKYMYQGRVDTSFIDSSSFYNNMYDTIIGQSQRVSIYDGSSSYYLRIFITPSVDTSQNSYLDIYLPGIVKVDDAFDGNTDCTYWTTAGSAVCTIDNSTANFLHITFKTSDSYSSTRPIGFPQGSTTQIRMKKISFNIASSTKIIYPIYFRLWRTSGVGAINYLTQRTIVVVPKLNTLSTVTFGYYSNIYNMGYQFPDFLRFQITNPAQLNYQLLDNQVRVISFFAYLGYGTIIGIKNQGAYPCTSNIGVTCIYEVGYSGNYNTIQLWERVHIYFTGTNQEITIPFHVIVPHLSTQNGGQYFGYLVGKHNQLTHDTNYLYMGSLEYRSLTTQSPSNERSNLKIDMRGKAGSYRTNVNVNVQATGGLGTSNFTFLMITSKWSFFENGISSLSSSTMSSVSPKPNFGINFMQPLSVYMGQWMYLTIIPYRYTTSLVTFNFTLDNVHMPYAYDLPDYHMTIIMDNKDTNSFSNFVMTSADVFYQSPLKSLTMNCQDNSLGVVNTICTIVFGTQHPFKANGTIRAVFDGMTVATDVCSLKKNDDATNIPVTCISTQDNKNVTVSIVDYVMTGNQHYPAGNFTVILHGIGINASSISQSVTLYLMDHNSKYVIEKGTRILTTTVLNPRTIQIYQILYLYSSPLSANTISIKFYLPRKLYDDQSLGFIMGKDLSDVNTQINRLRIQLKNSANVELLTLFELISSEYKVLFTFKDSSLLTQGNYTLKIYGIMTPASHQNGAFSIIYQRHLDKSYALTNQQTTAFPQFNDRIISLITNVTLFNTQGYDQELILTITNSELLVDDKMIWIINFPSYYTDKLFNYQPYCMIDGAPLTCYADPTTKFQLIITGSPRVIQSQTSYEITIMGLAAPRQKYTNHAFPNRYMFVGVLQSSSSTAYAQTALLYPQQDIFQTASGVITLVDMPGLTINQPSFSSIFAIMQFVSNVLIPTGSYFFINFPVGFDNFNNNDLETQLKIGTGSVYSLTATVQDRRIQLLVPSDITANTRYTITFPSLPTPKLQVEVEMSDTYAFASTSDKQQIFAASMVSGNSAPTVNFAKDPLYISFNHDNTIQITAGTYSSMIDITSSNGAAFLTNINVNLSSTGFLFEPSTVLLHLGDLKGQFRIGADTNLFPITYFYQTIKQDQVSTYYTITTNNNIKITNIPKTITIPTSITIPAGQCSQPIEIILPNPPFQDLTITFNYDNELYDENKFYPNQHTTKSQLQFSPTITSNLLSFCVASTMSSVSFPLKMVLTGSNYNSYAFTPSQNITINVVASSPIIAPVISIALNNQQKYFLDINFTTNVQGIIYYHLMLGEDSTPLQPVDLQIHLKNHEETLKSMDDYQNRLYLQQRDERVGIFVKPSGTFTNRFSELLPQKTYKICAYLQTFDNQITSAVCQVYSTSNWGTITKISLTFSKLLNDQQMNNVLCFFTKYAGTQVNFFADINGNSCDDRKVKNIHYKYQGVTYSSQRNQTFAYLASTPYKVSDPSPLALKNMYKSDTTALTSVSLASATSNYAINYLTSSYVLETDANDMRARTNAQKISPSFSKPLYNANTQTITINNVQTVGGQGTVYFLLVLYKQIVRTQSETYVNIRMNIPPSSEQLLNCQNWQGYPAQGCARAVFSTIPIQVNFTSIQKDSMYLLYYSVGTQYPFRPIMSDLILSDTVITYSWGINTITIHTTIFLAFLVILC